MLEDHGFVRVGRVTFQPPSTVAIHFDRREAESWGPAIFAFRMGDKVMRIGKTESTLKSAMLQHERLHSMAIGGHFQKGGTNPWEAFELRRSLIEHGGGELLAWRGSETDVRVKKRQLVRHYDPPLNNDSQCARSRPAEGRRVTDVVPALAYWRLLNNPSAGFRVSDPLGKGDHHLRAMSEGTIPGTSGENQTDESDGIGGKSSGLTRNEGSICLILSTLMSAITRCRRVNSWLACKRLFWALPGRAGGAVVETTVDHTLMRGSEPHDR